MLLVAGSSGVQAADYTKYGIEADVPGECSFEAIDAKDLLRPERSISLPMASPRHGGTDGAACQTI